MKENYFGECNAFETDWYDTETIETVKYEYNNGQKDFKSIIQYI